MQIRFSHLRPCLQPIRVAPAVAASLMSSIGTVRRRVTWTATYNVIITNAQQMPTSQKCGDEFQLNTFQNKAIRNGSLSLALKHVWRHNACFYHNARLTSWQTLEAYFGQSPNGEESLNIFLSPDPHHLREGPSHMSLYNTSCIKQSRQSEQ